MPDGGELTVAMVRTSDAVKIEIVDSGPGFAEGEDKQIYEPFYTTKSGGTGLGLAIVQRVAEAHGGEVSAANGPQGGAVMTIRIPQAAKEEAA